MKAKTVKILLISLLCMATAISGCKKQESAAQPEAVEEVSEAGDAGEASDAGKADEAAEMSEETEASEADDAVVYYPDPGIKENLPDERPSVNDDYFLHVNYDDLKNLEIPAGEFNISTLSILKKDAETATKKALADAENLTDENYKKVSVLYKEYQDMEKRNAAGWKNVTPLVERVEKVQSISEYIDLVNSDPVYREFEPIIPCAASADLKGDGINVICIDSPGVLLMDPAEYSNLTELGEIYKNANDTFLAKVFAKYGYDSETAEKMIQSIYDWECAEAKHMLTLEDTYSPDINERIYNPYTMEELIELAGDFPIRDILKAQGSEDQDKYVVYEPEWFGSLSDLYTEENLEKIKSNMICSILCTACSVTDEESLKLYTDWENEKDGSTGMKSLDEIAYDEVSQSFGELVGAIYAESTFTPEEKAAAEEIVYQVKDAMRSRLEKADWMSEETRATALEKIDAIVVNVGYAEEFYYDYSKMQILEENDLFTNYMNIQVEKTKQQLAHAGKPLNKKAWNNDMASNVVNACYRPDMNDICFPAAILHAPVFDKDASTSANYGGLGVVAGHELTHAFDTLGSQYDKNGKLQNWWKEEEWEAFTKLTDKVAQRYHAYATVDEERVNGDLTIGETVADLGGMAAALDVMRNMQEAGDTVNYKDFFEADAKFWIRVLTRENALYRLKADPHAPTCLRTNVNLMQFDEFYDTYEVVEGDPMYTAPEDRLKVW